MKKYTLIAFTLGIFVWNLNAQIAEIDGKLKITVMDTVSDIGTNVVRQSDGTLALRQYKIGDMAQGGIIFYVDETGEHGLVADTADVSDGIRWYAGSHGSTQAKGDGIFAGEMNTAIIISAQVAIGDDEGDYAARLCAELAQGGYSDWYLPSLEEMVLMFENLQSTGLSSFAEDFYWSSTEFYDESARILSFQTGAKGNGSKSNIEHVRAIRAF